MLVPDRADDICMQRLRRLRDVFGDRAFVALTLRAACGSESAADTSNGRSLFETCEQRCANEPPLARPMLTQWTDNIDACRWRRTARHDRNKRAGRNIVMGCRREARRFQALPVQRRRALCCYRAPMRTNHDNLVAIRELRGLDALHQGLRRRV
ncbi:MAG: hypothetical protein JWR89_5240 [Tardiphaga sp.]|nr:hypothetical protein [Tardiphaga sp.]